MHIIAAIVGLSMLYLLTRNPQVQQVARAYGLDEGLKEVQGAFESVAVAVQEVADIPAQAVAQKIDEVTGMGISKMGQVTDDLVKHPQVQAMLRVIRRGEGTADDAGYRRHFGGRLFDSFADHPRIKITASGYTSTAAGAYQFLASTWDETARIMGLGDFTPANQDRGAVGRMVYRRALDDVLAGRFESAISKLGKEWASLPGSPYGQPVISMDTAANTFAAAGGQFEGVA